MNTPDRECERERERERRAGDLPILLVLISPNLLSPRLPFYFFARRPHPSSRRSTARDIPSRFPSAATTIIKLTVLKSDSRDVTIRHTRYTLGPTLADADRWEIIERESRIARFNLPRSWLLSARRKQATWKEKKSTFFYISAISATIFYISLSPIKL